MPHPRPCPRAWMQPDHGPRGWRDPVPPRLCWQGIPSTAPEATPVAQPKLISPHHTRSAPAAHRDAEAGGRSSSCTEQQGGHCKRGCPCRAPRALGMSCSSRCWVFPSGLPHQAVCLLHTWAVTPHSVARSHLGCHTAFCPIRRAHAHEDGSSGQLFQASHLGAVQHGAHGERILEYLEQMAPPHTTHFMGPPPGPAVAQCPTNNSLCNIGQSLLRNLAASLAASAIC